MSIWIDEARCVGCGRCAEVCPGNLIGMGPAEASPRPVAQMRRPRDCWGCTACMKECPAGAISYFLGADMGGRGTRLQVKSSATQNVWEFDHPDGTVQTITVSKSQANKY